MNELENIITDIDSKCPDNLTRIQTEDEVHIMVNNISAEVFHKVLAYSSSCTNNASVRKKKARHRKVSTQVLLIDLSFKLI